MAPDAPERPQQEGTDARRAAWRAVRRVHERGTWSAPAVSRALDAFDLDARDRAFAANLAYETLRWEGTLDWALGQVVTRPLTDVEPPVLDVLRIGAWQLLFGHVPDRAAVGTSVDTARAEIGAKVTGFVNGVLRGLGRAKDQLRWPARADDLGLGLALGYPAWVVAEARARFGDRAEAVLEAGNRAPGVTLRALGSRDDLLAELAGAGVDAREGAHAPEAVRAPGVDPGRLAAVSEGRATAQDEASMLVVRALVAPALGGDGRLEAGWRAAELAAAPGSQSTHLAQLGAEVVAGDVRLSRARLISEAADRLDLGGRIHVVVGDAAAPPLRRQAFDGVLLDAPCSGLGVVRRRPELRWTRLAQDPERLGELQLQLLDGAAELVRPGGLLTFSVCTWTVAETAQVVRSFAAIRGDEFELLDTPALVGAGTALAGDPGVQLAPDTDDTDGMYIACFRRRP
jgi:16S rRNA (cytosine967-C5)-methyltransferase